jgi:hypothetical protein
VFTSSKLPLDLKVSWHLDIPSRALLLRKSRCVDYLLFLSGISIHHRYMCRLFSFRWFIDSSLSFSLMFEYALLKIKK